MSQPVLPPPPTPLKINTKTQADPDYFEKKVLSTENNINYR